MPSANPDRHLLNAPQALCGQIERVVTPFLGKRGCGSPTAFARRLDRSARRAQSRRICTEIARNEGNSVQILLLCENVQILLLCFPCFAEPRNRTLAPQAQGSPGGPPQRFRSREAPLRTQEPRQGIPKRTFHSREAAGTFAWKPWRGSGQSGRQRLRSPRPRRCRRTRGASPSPRALAGAGWSRCRRRRWRRRRCGTSSPRTRRSR